MRRAVQVALGAGVIILALAFILWNTSASSAPPAMGVRAAKEQASFASGTEATVRGNVLEGTIVSQEGRVVEFVVADTTEHLRVSFNQTPPDNFGAKEVVVKGVLKHEGGKTWLEASTIQVGCASKY